MPFDCVEGLPQSILQDEQYRQRQQQEQAEAINENFYDEVRQLLEQKFGHSSEAAVETETVLTTPAAPSESDSEEQYIEQTTVSTPQVSLKNTLPAVKPPSPKKVNDWPKLDLRLGQVTAVSIGLDGHPVIFHRADRIWTEE